MKKLLLILLSVLCVLVNTTSLFAEEKTDFEKLAEGRGYEYSVGDVLDLPFSIVEDDDSFKEQNAKFLVIGKDEDYQNTLTLMSIEPLKIYDECNYTVLNDGDLTQIKDDLKNGTYSDDTYDVELEYLSGYKNSMFFTTKDKDTELSIDNSTIDAFNTCYAILFGSLSGTHSAFVKRIVNVEKEYAQKDGTTGTIISKFWLPSLKELGFSTEVGKGNAYSLFASKNVMGYLDEKVLDSGKELMMLTRDIDYNNKSIYLLDHDEEDGYKKSSDVYEPVKFGFCFTVTYDEDVTEYKNPTGDTDVQLYSVKPSTYYVVLPKRVYVQSEKTTPFNFEVYGEIETSKRINISMPTSVLLENISGIRNDITLNIKNSLKSISYIEIENGKIVRGTVEVTSPRIYAGSWEVNLPITISLDKIS